MLKSNISIIVGALTILLYSFNAFQLNDMNHHHTHIQRISALFERKCDLTGRRQNSKCNSISKSGVRTHRVQGVNLHYKKYWWPTGNTFVRVRVATRTMKTIALKGIERVAKDNGVNLRQFRISCSTLNHSKTNSVYDFNAAQFTQFTTLFISILPDILNV